jgi:hypothetical protein
MVARRTREVAGELISKFRETGNLGRLLVDVSDFGRWFGRFGRYNRELFEKALVEEIGKPPALTMGNHAMPCLRFVSREFDEEVKCPGCNWGTLALFALETEKDIEENGLCGQCCMETMVAEQIRIPCDELNLPGEIVEGQLAEAVKNAEAGP